MIDLSEVGAYPTLKPNGEWQVRIGIYLPEITPEKGYVLKARIIHEADQFVRSIPAQAFDLAPVPGSPLGLWRATIDLTPEAGTHFGQTGRHLYRFQLLRDGGPVVFWFSDPFGRESATGNLSAFAMDPAAVPFPWTDAAYRTPHLDDLVVYELHVGEFNRTFDGVVTQLDYLAGLGVNALELMPFTNVKETAEWGYTPLSYFAPDERFGGPAGLRRLVDACHARGIAVILDAVYAHAHPEFAYNLVYNATGEPNPMMGPFQGEFFPDLPGTDYAKAFTRDYFLTLNRYWLEEYHLDGFRYDYVPGMFDGGVGTGYAALTYHTYQISKPIPRFQDPAGFSRIIQCAEHLPEPQRILTETYSNCCWQNGLMDKVANSAYWGYADPALALLLDPQLQGYPQTYANPGTGETFPVAPFQYLESHDNPRLLARIAPSGLRDLIGEPWGDRSQFYRLQPYVIALYVGKGIPMLWQGQEIGENWGMAPWGLGRNLFERPVRWEYFYDPYGQALVRLHRIMGSLRRSLRALGSRTGFYYYNDPAHYGQGIIVIRREAPAAGIQPKQTLMAFINVSGAERRVWVPFPEQGTWVEQIDKAESNPRPDISVAFDGEWHEVPVPSHYGCIYLKS